jgi:hypothetical protein
MVLTVAYPALGFGLKPSEAPTQPTYIPRSVTRIWGVTRLNGVYGRLPGT